MVDENDVDDPENDPDLISDDSSRELAPGGQQFFSAGSVGIGTPAIRARKSIPLEEDDLGSDIPPALLWAMKYRRHLHLLSKAEIEIRDTLGTGDGAVYVIDDGRKHCAISRLVGTNPDGCLYCLVAQITTDAYDRLARGEAPLDSAFSGARDLALCSVYEAEREVSNVSIVRQFADIGEVPPDYLPPNPPITFDADLDVQD